MLVSITVKFTQLACNYRTRSSWIIRDQRQFTEIIPLLELRNNSLLVTRKHVHTTRYYEIQSKGLSKYPLGTVNFLSNIIFVNNVVIFEKNPRLQDVRDLSQQTRVINVLQNIKRLQKLLTSAPHNLTIQTTWDRILEFVNRPFIRILISYHIPVKGYLLFSPSR